MNTASSLRPSAAAVRDRLALQLLPCVMMTMAISQWTIAVLGTTKVPARLITFAWAAITGHQLVTSRRTEQKLKFRWSVDHILRALGGQIVWVVLPWMQHAQPDAWYCRPLSVSSTLAGLGAVVAVCWPLRLFLVPARAVSAPARHSELDALVLYGSFFLMSGNLIFAVSACISVVTLFAKEKAWHDALVRSRLAWAAPLRHGAFHH